MASVPTVVLLAQPQGDYSTFELLAPASCTFADYIRFWRFRHSRTKFHYDLKKMFLPFWSSVWRNHVFSFGSISHSLFLQCAAKSSYEIPDMPVLSRCFSQLYELECNHPAVFQEEVPLLKRLMQRNVSFDTWRNCSCSVPANPD